MAPLAKDRNTQRRSTWDQRVYPVAASTTIYAGALVALNAAGFAVPAANTAGQRVVGVADRQVINSTVTDGAKTITVKEGNFYFANDGTATLVAADRGNPCYVVDDQTVGDRGTAGIIAGIVIEIDSGGVWIDVRAENATAGNVGLETVSLAGAVSVDTRTTILGHAAAIAITLADGRYHGQRKNIRQPAASGANAATLTPATPSGFATLAFDAANEWAELEWRLGVGWIIIAAAGVTIA
jgi:hypothetical protein